MGTSSGKPSNQRPHLAWEATASAPRAEESQQRGCNLAGGCLPQVLPDPWPEDNGKASPSAGVRRTQPPANCPCLIARSRRPNLGWGGAAVSSSHPGNPPTHLDCGEAYLWLGCCGVECEELPCPASRKTSKDSGWCGQGYCKRGRTDHLLPWLRDPPSLPTRNGEAAAPH